MSEEHDSRLSELYRQSSQETPPAHLDRAVMEMARTSVRRRAFSPFGGHWLAGGALVGVVVLSVLLVLDVPRQPVRYDAVPTQDELAPASDAPLRSLKEVVQPGKLSSKISAETEEKREAPTAPKPRFEFHETLPDMDAVVPEDATRMRLQRQPAAALEKPAAAAGAAPTTNYYLQAGSFRDRERADALLAKLTRLGFKGDVQEIRINTAEAYHRVRVGPFTDLEVLDKSRQKLGELGIETRTVEYRE
jgi:cell division protein FtsN